MHLGKNFTKRKKKGNINKHLMKDGGEVSFYVSSLPKREGKHL